MKATVEYIYSVELLPTEPGEGSLFLKVDAGSARRPPSIRLATALGKTYTANGEQARALARLFRDAVTRPILAGESK